MMDISVVVVVVFFFFKQKTAYEIRNCDWSSDVCSSDLGWTDGRTDGRADGRTYGISPHSTGLRPLLGPLPCYVLRFHHIKEAGQGYR